MKKSLIFLGLFGVFFAAFCAAIVNYPINNISLVLFGILLFLQIFSVVFAAMLPNNIFFVIIPVAWTTFAGSVFGLGFHLLFALGLPFALLFALVRATRKNRINISISESARRPLTTFFLLSSLFSSLFFGGQFFEILAPFAADIVRSQAEIAATSESNTLAENFLKEALAQCQGNAQCEAAAQEKFAESQKLITEKINEEMKNFDSKNLREIIQSNSFFVAAENAGISFDLLFGILLFLLIAPFSFIASALITISLTIFFWIFRALGIFSVEYQNVPQQSLV